MTDDQGYGDLSCMGATDFRTPNLDRLGSGGRTLHRLVLKQPGMQPFTRRSADRQIPRKCRGPSDSARASHGIGTALTPHPRSHPSSKIAATRHPWSASGTSALPTSADPTLTACDYWFGFLAGCIDFYSHIYYWGANRPGPGDQPNARPLGEQRGGLARQRILHRTNRREVY